MPYQFATVVELDAWLGPRSPADPLPLLRTASRIVAHAVRVAVPLNDDGTVTDADQRQALSDATCAQVDAMLGGSMSGSSTNDGGFAQTLDGFVLSTEPTDGEAVEASFTTNIAPDALTILRTAGLVNPTVASR